MNVNKVFIAGRLTNDVETKSVGNEREVLNFSIAVNEPYKDKEGNWKEETDFFEVEYFKKEGGKLTEKLKKGTQVFIEGKLKQNTWETKEGEKRSKVRIRVDKIQVISYPKDKEQ